MNFIYVSRSQIWRHYKWCAHDLKIANKNLDSGAVEKEKRADEVYNDLEEMMFTVSHRVRKSVANILGISNLLQTDKSLNIEEWREMVRIIIKSAESLNTSTEELSKFIHLKKNNCSNN